MRLANEAEAHGVTIEQWIEFLLDEHTDQSYDRLKKLNISVSTRKQYFGDK